MDIFEFAMKMEMDGKKYYESKAALTKEKSLKKILLTLAEEEQHHVHMIESVLSYLKFPEAFAESAQFNNFQSLEGH